MDRLDDIEAFLAVVEKGSLTAAARHLERLPIRWNRSRFHLIGNALFRQECHTALSVRLIPAGRIML